MVESDSRRSAMLRVRRREDDVAKTSVEEKGCAVDAIVHGRKVTARFQGRVHNTVPVDRYAAGGSALNQEVLGVVMAVVRTGAGFENHVGAN